jgi:tRNA pseudouridine38-40 synthase
MIDTTGGMTEPSAGIATAAGSKRYFIELAYNGGPFHGWQRQPGDMSVQQAIEEALAMVLRLPGIAITGAGRTDAGVNASQMIAHVDLPDSIVVNESTEGRLLRGLNSLLAPNIVIYQIRQVHADAHARFDAVSRSYRYYAHTLRTPFAGGFSWLAPANLDFEQMNRAAEILLETEDFTSFSKLHTDVKTNICHVTHALWREFQPTKWVFEITADRFLRNMVRAVVGTLVEVGRGKLTIEGFREVIERRDRCAAGTSMPAGPLFLHEVKYPYYESRFTDQSTIRFQ